MPDLLNSAVTFIAAAGALGTAAYGLVDGSKVFRGGISNAGFGHLQRALARFHTVLTPGGDGVPLIETIRANWLNGIPKADQKAAAKSLIRLGITPKNAPTLAEAVGISSEALTAAAAKISNGTPLEQEDINILGRFDVFVEAILDLGYERADQLYRNSAKACSALVAVILAIVAAYLLDYNHPKIVEAVFVGIVATPLAPIAKDLASSLSAAVSALKATRG